MNPENFSQNNSEGKNTRELPDDLDNALHFLKNNGSFSKIYQYLKDNGVQEKFKIEGKSKEYVVSGARMALNKLRNFLYATGDEGQESRGIAFNQLRTVLDVGLLDLNDMNEVLKTWVIFVEASSEEIEKITELLEKKDLI
jgi:hypothetical protein